MPESQNAFANAMSKAELQFAPAPCVRTRQFPLGLAGRCKCPRIGDSNSSALLPTITSYASAHKLCKRRHSWSTPGHGVTDAVLGRFIVSRVVIARVLESVLARTSKGRFETEATPVL
jgi:hypothetical protein